MNAKLCKALRMESRKNTVGQPARGWIQVRQPTSNPEHPVTIGCGNDPATFRGNYRSLKKLVMARPSLGVALTRLWNTTPRGST